VYPREIEYPAPLEFILSISEALLSDYPKEGKRRNLRIKNLRGGREKDSSSAHNASFRTMGYTTVDNRSKSRRQPRSGRDP